MTWESIGNFSSYMSSDVIISTLFSLSFAVSLSFVRNFRHFVSRVLTMEATLSGIGQRHNIEGREYDGEKR
jgi:hypothetical protein